MKIDLRQMCVYNKVVKYVIEAECREPLHVGTGNGERGEVLIHPEENRPFVQAAGIAGAFREFYQYDKALQASLFGAPYKEDKEKADEEEEGKKKEGREKEEESRENKEKESCGGGSRVFFTDGFFGKSAVYTELRPRLRIDRRTGTGQSAKTKGSERRSGQKFEMESVAAGSLFSFSIYLYEKGENLETELEHGLRALHEGRIQLGGQKSNGCGYVELISVKRAVYDFYESKDRELWAEESKHMEELLPGLLKSGENEERLCFELSGQTEGGILVKAIAVTEYGADAPDAVNIRNHQREYILPASSVKGVLRSQIEKIAAYRKTPGLVTEIFGKESNKNQDGRAGRIRCFDCKIGDPKENEGAPIQKRIHIDKFTGGVMYGGLFSEKPVRGHLTVRVELEEGSEGNNPDKESGMILMALRDLAMGLVPVGSGSSIGRGYLKGDKITVKKGARTLAEIDCQNGRIANGSSYVEQCLKALGQTGEG